MRLCFMGTPAIAVPALEEISARHEVALVVTAPPRPRGRGRQMQESDVAQAAHRLGLRVMTPERLRDEALQEILGARFEAVAVVAYGRMLPAALHTQVPCLNLHPSLLPRHRGAAPIPWTIWSGDENWGITIMRIVQELDAGPIVLQEAYPLGLETAGEIAALAATRGAAMLLEALDLLARGRLQERSQSGEATYARMFTQDDERLDFTRSARDLARQVRALSPRPGVRVRLSERDLELRLLDARAEDGRASMGQCLRLPDGLGFGTADGILAVRTVQPAGRGAQTWDEFLRGRPWAVGMVAQ